MKVERSSARALNVKYEDAWFQPPSGDDLFDVLGEDLKSKLLKGKWNNVLAEGPDPKNQNLGKATSIFRDMQNVFTDIFHLRVIRPGYLLLGGHRSSFGCCGF